MIHDPHRHHRLRLAEATPEGSSGDGEADARWLELADQISRGESVDWAAAGLTATDENDRAILRSLGSIASITQLHSSDQALNAGAGDAVTDADADDAVTDANARGVFDTNLEQWGRLEIKERLGYGSYGTVYRAHDPQLQRDVALKLLHPGKQLPEAARERLRQEGRHLARIQHDNVVSIYGIEEHEGQFGLWMELVRGRTLANIVQNDGPFSESEGIVVGQSLARALAAVHAAGLIHRDVKAQNVMRAEGGRLVLMDFGAGTTPDHDAQAGTQRSVPGTPMYLAPELLRGEDVTPASDVYSLGVLLFHLVTGSFPVTATSLDELKAMHASGNATSAADLRSELSPAFVNVLRTALASDPSERFATAGQLSQALDQLQHGTSETQLNTAPTPNRRRRWTLAIAALAALAALTLTSQLNLFGPAQFTVEGRLLREDATSRTELMSGAAVGVGDQLSFELNPSTEVYAYVVNVDAVGNAYVLFPIAGCETTNPLAAETTHRLPGICDGVDSSWTVDSSGDREQVLVVASREPLVDLEAKLASLPAAGGNGAYVKLDDQSLLNLRGIGGLSARPSGTGAKPGIFDEIAELTRGPSSTEGVWVRRIDLNNPK